MRVKAEAVSLGDRQGSAERNTREWENTHLKLIKQAGRPTFTPTGKGLGKAGAKRLGRLLKRAIQDQVEPEGKKATLPKTPVRLFKHQIETEEKNGPKANAAKPASHQVSQLILNVVSQCKRRGGISMAELKQTMAAGGYNVTKKNRQVKVVTTRLVNNETIVRTTRNTLYRLNNKQQRDTMQVSTSIVKSPKPKGDLKKSKAARKSPEGAKKSQRQAKNTPRPKGKTRRVTTRPQKVKGKTRKPAARSHKPRWKTRKARGNLSKPAGKKHSSAKNKAARVHRATKKAQRAQRRRPKHIRHPYKSSRKRQAPRRKIHKTRTKLKTRQRPAAKRRAYYYYYD